MGVALRAATVEDAPQTAEVLLSSRMAFLPYAPLVHTDAEVHLSEREAIAQLAAPSASTTTRGAATRLPSTCPGSFRQS